MLDVAVVLVFPALWLLWTVVKDPLLCEWTIRHCDRINAWLRVG